MDSRDPLRRPPRLTALVRTPALVVLGSVIALGAVAAVAVRGHDTGGPDVAVVDQTSGTDSGADVPWVGVDACGLLDDQQVAEALGRGDATAVSSSTGGRPACVWSAPGGARRLRLLLWSPPAPELLTRGVTRVPVGDAAGYVRAPDDARCFMNVEADPAWLQLELVPAHPVRDLCQAVAAPLAERALQAPALADIG